MRHDAFEIVEPLCSYSPDLKFCLLLSSYGMIFLWIDGDDNEVWMNVEINHEKIVLRLLYHYTKVS